MLQSYLFDLLPYKRAKTIGLGHHYMLGININKSVFVLLLCLRVRVMNLNCIPFCEGNLTSWVPEWGSAADQIIKYQIELRICNSAWL